MKNKFCVILISGVLLLTCTSVFGKYPIKILPLGDSITHADSSHYSYRYKLWKKLIDSGIEFDFIGSMNTNSGGNPVWPQYKGLSFDQNHEGHSGWRAEELLYGRPSNPELGDLTDWLKIYTPDIVLLHIGTNDLGAGQSYSSTANEIKLIIDTIRMDNQDVTILLAKIIPRNYTYNNIIAFNEYIEPIAQEKKLPNSPVIVVDQWTGFSYEEDTYDGTHPNTSGEEKMAEKWFQTIVQYTKGFDSNFNLDDKVNTADLYYITENWTTKLSANIYLGQNFNDVKDATPSSPACMGNFADCSYQPAALEPDTTYYWRIDEIDSNMPHKGEIWQFTTGSNNSNIGWWKLDGTTDDLSSNNNDAVALGDISTKSDPNWVKGFYFDDADDYIQVPNESAFDLTNKITIAAWVRLDADADGLYTIASKGNSFWLYVDNYGRNTVFYCQGLGTPAVGLSDISDGQWHHVVATYDGTARAVYIDGVKDGSRPTTKLMVLNDEPLLIGNNESNTDNNNFKGMIREFRIYSEKLSDDQILWLSKTGNYAPQPYNGQNNINTNPELIFSPLYWMQNKSTDLNKDFVIDFQDFSIFANEWQK